MILSNAIMKKICPYCKETIEVSTGRQFSSHCGNCKSSPNYRRKIENQRKATLAKRQTFHLECAVCHKPYSISTTPNLFARNKYRKTCSTKCAHKREQSPILRQRKSRTLTRLTIEEKMQKKRLRGIKNGRKKRLAIRALMSKYLGEDCFFCKNHNSLQCHRKDGKPHKDPFIMNNKEIAELSKQFEKGDFVRVCYACHKGVHWCMTHGNLTWGKIIILFSKNNNQKV